MGKRWWWLLLAFAGGCAGGTGGSGTNLTGFGDVGPTAGEPTSSTGVETTSISATTIGETAGASTGTMSAADDSVTAEGTTASAETSTGGDESSTGGSSTGTAELMCPQDLTCPTALVLGTVSGDEGSPLLNDAGTDAVWVTFLVTEDEDGIGGESLSFTATLTSPACCDFDLYAFRGPEGGTTGCGGSPDDSTSVGATDVVSMTWGEGGIANGADDSAWVALEIVPKNDECDPTQEWTLVVEGDT